MFLSDKWNDIEIIDTSCGERLERWGKYILVRPDPQVIWQTEKEDRRWNAFNARYHRSSSGGGKWEVRNLPEQWQLSYGKLVFNIKPTGFKHTGIFPEQAVNWEFCMNKIRNAGRPVSVLNLFAYTGGATLACASAGASVCHVDASKGIVAWAKENAVSSGLENASIRYIVDDCKKFLEREIRRGKRYDAIIMDPPSYGRGPGGELWKLEDSLHGFMDLVVQVLSDDPLFVMLNSYTTGLSASVMSYMLGVTVQERFGGTVTADEIGLPVTNSGCNLPCGSTAIWQSK